MDLLAILEPNNSKLRSYIMELLSETFFIIHWLKGLVGIICLVGSYAHPLPLFKSYWRERYPRRSYIEGSQIIHCISPALKYQSGQEWSTHTTGWAEKHPYTSTSFMRNMVSVASFVPTPRNVLTWVFNMPHCSSSPRSDRRLWYKCRERDSQNKQPLPQNCVLPQPG
jgi:hypothetical protein